MRRLGLYARPAFAVIAVFVLAISVLGQAPAGQTPPAQASGATAQAGQGAAGGFGGMGAGRGRGAQAVTGPWSDKTLSPDRRADLVLEQMTLDEKISLLHGGPGGMGGGAALTDGRQSNGGAGWVPGIARFGMPDINMADSAVGVTRGSAQSRYSTLLPSSLGAAANWNSDLALLYGQVIGRELRDQGYNMSIGGGVNLTREPRNGRNFEYAGEDPILAGTTVGLLMKGVQSQQVMGDLKHYALNDQENGRNTANVLIDKRSMRESDLLAFQIAHKISDAAGFMCSYNLVNGDWACENDYLLNQVLKKDLGFKGWVLSDWGGTHSAKKAIMAGLDQEQPGSGFFGDTLKQAVQSGEVPISKINDSVHRILRSMFATGVWDNPPTQRRVVDVFKGLEDAQKIEEESIVVLKNAANQLPLNAAATRSIAVIGGHADVGVPSGGGSAQVNAPGGNAVPPAPAQAGQGGGGGGMFGMGGRGSEYFPSAPLKFIKAKVPNAKVAYNEGSDPAAAAALAKTSQVAIVFVTQPMSEGSDAATLSLPNKQDDLVSAVAAANPHTIVVLETGGPITMPWADKVSGILSAWFPGIGGGPAIANVLFGDVNPSGKLPVTFAKADADLPHPTIASPAARGGAGAPGVAPGAAPGAGRGAAAGANLTPEQQQQAMQQQQLTQAQQAVTQALQQASTATDALLAAQQRLTQAQRQLAQAAPAAGGSPTTAMEAATKAIQAALAALQAAQPAPAAGRGGMGGRGGGTPFDVKYDEGLKVGYKWYDAENKTPLFPFGFGLSYTTYAYSNLKANVSGHNLTVSFDVKNTGKRAGKEIAQVYLSLPSSTNEPPKRLIGWQKVELAPGESKTVTLTIDPLYISIFNEASDSFQVTAGAYRVMAGPSSRNLPLTQTVTIN
jgi:beta-glucosidase